MGCSTPPSGCGGPTGYSRDVIAMVVAASSPAWLGASLAREVRGARQAGLDTTGDVFIGTQKAAGVDAIARRRTAHGLAILTPGEVSDP